MLLTGHKSRAIFDRYNIINEQELLDAGDQLVEYLAQQAQAVPARRRPHAVGHRRPAHRITLSASCDAPPRKPPRAGTVRGHGAGRRRVAGHRLSVRRRLKHGLQVRTGPAIVAHVATGRADAADHGHVLGSTEAPRFHAERL